MRAETTLPVRVYRAKYAGVGEALPTCNLEKFSIPQFGARDVEANYRISPDVAYLAWRVSALSWILSRLPPMDKRNLWWLRS